MKRIDIKIAILLAFICFVSGFFLVPYQLQSLKAYLSTSEYEAIAGELPFPIEVLSLITSIQLFVMIFVLAFLGIKLARRTGFSFSLLASLLQKGEKMVFNRKSFFLSIFFGVITGFIIVGSDKFYFQHMIPELGHTVPQFSFLGLITGVLSGGVFEEVLLRLFFMSLLVWIFHQIFTRKNKCIPMWNYWISLILAALVFAAGHLPITSMLFGELNGMIVFRCFLLNGIGGLFFGYLYWKKGFEYGVIAHMFTHISMQLVFIPFLY
jgi:hypothetical protein